jgi:hypothetical protein
VALELYAGDRRQTAIDVLVEEGKSLPAGEGDGEIRRELGADTVPHVRRCGDGVQSADRERHTPGRCQ